jgi:hypothetical protein
LTPVAARPTVTTLSTSGAPRHSRNTPCPTIPVAPKIRTLIVLPLCGFSLYHEVNLNLPAPHKRIQKKSQQAPGSLRKLLPVEVTMAQWKRAALLGLLSWMIPFAISFVAFPLKKQNAVLFSTLMFLVVLVVAGALLIRYFGHRPVAMREAAVVGAVWLAINLVCDYPMFAYGPMKMTAASYYSEIGLVYLTYPIFALLAAGLARH